jgi:hypothetical protein
MVLKSDTVNDFQVPNYHYDMFKNGVSSQTDPSPGLPIATGQK